MKDVRGRTALVTGASSGIGADRLEALAREISATGETAEAAPCDLSDAAGRAALAARYPNIDILINNAGLGVFGLFEEAAWDRLDDMLEIDIVALTHLTHLFARKMTARGRGRIMLVASVAAFQPVPMYAAYAAAKAYVLSLGEALDVELKAKGVRVTTLCPGVTESEFFAVAGHQRSKMMESSIMTSAAVAKTGVDALLRGRSSVVAGKANALLALGTRLAPRSLNAKAAFRMMKP